MPKEVNLDIDLLIGLRRKGWSHQSLADRFKVSKSTIKNILRDKESDKEVLAFAEKVKKLLAEVPNEYCRLEMNRTIRFLQTNAAGKDIKFKKIVEVTQSGARELNEIAEESELTETEAEELLDEMVEEKKIERRPRGGILNRGRKMKFHFYPVAA